MPSLRDDPATTRRILTERQAEIGDLLDLGEGVAAGVNDHPEQHALDQDAERRRRLELLRIEGALERLATGEYGFCLVCGESISDGRLEADPAVALCVACADRG